MKHIIATLLALSLIGCSAAASSNNNQQPELPIENTQKQARGCQTIPNNATGALHQTLGASTYYYYGNDRIWTYVASTEQFIVEKHQIEADGSTLVKWPWFHEKSVSGDLAVKGFIAGEDPATAINITSKVNQTTSKDLPENIAVLTTYLTVPKEGCWNVMAQKGAEQVSFVLDVVYAK
jgi:hypothetical protein